MNNLKVIFMGITLVIGFNLLWITTVMSVICGVLWLFNVI